MLRWVIRNRMGNKKEMGKDLPGSFPISFLLVVLGKADQLIVDEDIQRLSRY